MKVLTLVIHFYTNLVASGAPYAQKILRETSILHIFQYILTNNIGQDIEDLLINCARMVNLLISSADSLSESDDSYENYGQYT